MKTIIFLLIISIILISCPQSGPAPMPGSETCPLAYSNLDQLCKKDPIVNDYCCQVSAPTKKGKSYVQFCEEKQSQGISLHPDCLSKITSCNQIDACTGSN